MDAILYICLTLFILAVSSIILPGLFGAVWLPTPSEDIKNLLKAGSLKKGETLIDLGSGDGKVLMIAAKEFGANCIGYDIDPLKVLLSRVRIKLAGLEKSITVRWSSAKNADISSADILFIYLSHQVIDSIKPKLKNDLKEDAKIITFGFLISGLPVWKVYGNKKGFIYRAGVGKKINSIM